MPREARIKTDKAIFHIMVRSIKEINLFNDHEDKCKYFELMKRYQIQFNFKVYGYCLMDNHGHFIINVNGADISRIMQSINGSFARYYNRKYDRYGHVFQDRFKSRVVITENYMMNLSAYIHNNAKDIPGYKGRVEKYEYSSLSSYLEEKQDKFHILNRSFLTNMLGFKFKINKKKYLNFLGTCNTLDDLEREVDVEFNKPCTEYRSERKILVRDYSKKKIIEYVTSYTKVAKEELYRKYNRKAKETRALCAFFMSCFCNYTHKEICEVIGNITSSRVSTLCKIGYELILEKEKYNRMLYNFVQIE